MAKRNNQFIWALKTIAPGTDLRRALDHILDSKTGALIVIGDTDDVFSLVNGGFRLDCEFTPTKLYELSKMDGGIVIDKKISKIIFANAHFVPDSNIPTEETGIRHRTAERISKQTGVMVISISERLHTVSIYVDNKKHTLEDINIITVKANQALQTLEQYKRRFNQVMKQLNVLEFDNSVTLEDVLVAVQRAEMLQRIGKEVESCIVRLGSEGRLIKMQMDELMGNVIEENFELIRDYSHKNDKKSVEKIINEMAGMSSELLLNYLNIAKVFGYTGSEEVLEEKLYSRGYRVMAKIPRLPQAIIDNIVDKFGSLQNIMRASVRRLDDVEGVGDIRARLIRDNLKKMAEKSLAEI